MFLNYSFARYHLAPRTQVGYPHQTAADSLFWNGRIGSLDIRTKDDRDLIGVSSLELHEWVLFRTSEFGSLARFSSDHNTSRHYLNNKWSRSSMWLRLVAVWYPIHEWILITKSSKINSPLLQIVIITASSISGAFAKFHGYLIGSFHIVKYDNAGFVTLVSSWHLWMTWLGPTLSLVFEKRDSFSWSRDAPSDRLRSIFVSPDKSIVNIATSNQMVSNLNF